MNQWPKAFNKTAQKATSLHTVGVQVRLTPRLESRMTIRGGGLLNDISE